MGDAIVWWIVLELLGLAALPLAGVLMSGLPDRGYSLAKPLGLLLTGWLAYTIAMMQLAQFGRGLLIMCLVIVAMASAWLLFRKGGALWAETRERFRSRSFLQYVIIAEVLFTLGYILYAFFRAHNPDIFGTEKFMDFGFMNAIAKSGSFPPNDPWLAGYPINYYYFGYVLMTALSVLSGVPTEVGFNLANVTLFALTLLGSFGVAFNLIALSRSGLESAKAEAAAVAAIPKRRVRAGAAAAPTVPTTSVPARRSVRSQTGGAARTTTAATAVIEPEVAPAAADTAAGNGRAKGAVPASRDGAAEPPQTYEPYDRSAEITRARGPYFFALLAALMVTAMGNLSVSFAVKDGNFMEGNSWRYCFLCQNSQNFNWWNPSRIIQDYRTVVAPDQTVSKERFGVETINEFPAFSFLLADMHPHVIALPFVLLALGCALALARRKVVRGRDWGDGLPRGGQAWLSLVLVAIVAGALYPLNTWDFPTYLLLILIGLALPYIAHTRQGDSPRGWRWIRPWLVQSALIGVISIVSFIFFHLTFKSPVGGGAVQLPEGLANLPLVGWLLEKLGGVIALNPADKTITGFLVVFGIFLVGLVGWLAYELSSYWARRREDGEPLRDPWVLAAIALVSLLLAFVLRFPLLGLLFPMAVAAIYLIWHEPDLTVRNMALALAAVGTVIGLGVEIFYLRDVFNDRQNTLFKFYYQMWVLWSLASAYGVWRVLAAAFARREESTQARDRGANPFAKGAAAVWAGAFGLLVLSGLMYSVNGPLSKLGPSPVARGLDGMQHFQNSAPGDYEALKWLKANGSGSDIVLECCRDEYNNPGHAGRVSAFTGVPTLISWGGHEAQWRGGQPELMAMLEPRRQLTNAVYQGNNPNNPGQRLTGPELLSLLQQNGVDYVFVGAVERGEGAAAGGYLEERVTPEAEALFREVLSPAFTSGSTVIYRVPAGPSGAVNSKF